MIKIMYGIFTLVHLSLSKNSMPFEREGMRPFFPKKRLSGLKVAMGFLNKKKYFLKLVIEGRMNGGFVEIVGRRIVAIIYFLTKNRGSCEAFP
jgi:hypothetical protein